MEQFLLAFQLTSGVTTTNGATNLVVHMKATQLDSGQDIAFLDALVVMSQIGIGVIGKIAIGIINL